MRVAELRNDEAEALAALRDLSVLDSARDAEIDALAEIAATICGVPIALVSLIDTDRQWFKANVGLTGVDETPRDLAFCAHAVLGDDLFVVPNAIEDERFADNPLVTGDPAIRFYAGAPVSVDGTKRIGTVCVIDREPRELSAVQLSTLRNLAIAVGKALEGRAATLALHQEKTELQRVIELQDRTAQALNDAQRLGGIGSWSADLASDRSSWSSEMYRIDGRDTALPPPSMTERLQAFMPESRERLRQAQARCRQAGLPYVLELEFVRRSDGEHRWLETRGDAVRDGQGRIVGLQGTVQDITERKRLTRELAQQHELARVALQQLRQVTNSLPALISYLDGQERFRFANQLYADWFGRDPHELVGTSVCELYGQATYDRFKTHLQRAMGGEKVTYSRELTTLRGRRHVDVSLVPDLDAQGRVEGLFVMMIDATARRDAEAALQQSERRLRMVADHIPALVTYLDADERYRFVNDHHSGVFRTDPRKLLGRSMRETAGEALYGEIAGHVAAALRGEEVTFEGVWAGRDQRYHYQSTYVPDIDEAGAVRGFYAMTFDITALKETQGRLDALARVDSLTALPNRRHFDERLPEAMARTRRSRVPLALLFLDIDHFKRINDTLGHGVGDAVLKEFAARLKRQVRGTDLVARLAGDEFVVLLEGIRDSAQAEQVARKIVHAVRPPVTLEDRSAVDVTTSVGVALYDGGDRSEAELLAAADRALYKAKRQGRDGFALASEAVTTAQGLLPAGAELLPEAARG